MRYINRRGFTQGCVFWVSWWWIITVMVKSPPKPHFGDLNRWLKANMRKIRTAISSGLCIRLTWNSTGSCGQQQRLRGWSRTAAILKIDITPYLSENHPIFMTWSKMTKLHWTDSEFDRTYFLLPKILVQTFRILELLGGAKYCGKAQVCDRMQQRYR